MPGSRSRPPGSRRTGRSCSTPAPPEGGRDCVLRPVPRSPVPERLGTVAPGILGAPPPVRGAASGEPLPADLHRRRPRRFRKGHGRDGSGRPDDCIGHRLGALSCSGRNPRPVFVRTGEYLIRSTRDRFRDQQSPQGGLSYRVGSDEMLFGTGIIHGAPTSSGPARVSTAWGTPVPWGDAPSRPWLRLSRGDLRTIGDMHRKPPPPLAFSGLFSWFSSRNFQPFLYAFSLENRA